MEKFKLNIKSFELFLILTGTISFIFLWDVKLGIFQFRYLITILIIPIFFYMFQNFKKKYFKKIYLILLCFIFLLSHLLINLLLDKQTITFYSILGIIFFMIILAISLYYNDKIIDNIYPLIILFLIVFSISSFFGIIFNKADTPYFCGGLPDIFNFFSNENFSDRFNPDKYYGKASTLNRISFKEFLFFENSHLGMIAPGVIIYGVYRFLNKQNSIFFNFFLILFLLICLIKSSTTLLVGGTISIIAIVLFNFNKINFKTKIFYFLILILFSSTLILSKECRQRFIPIYVDDKDNKVSMVDEKITKGIEEVYGKIWKERGMHGVVGNMSSAIYFHHLTISLRSIIDKPFGWGINRYESALEHYNKKFEAKNSRLNSYNRKDGTNNFNKIIVEFGIFGIAFFVLVFLYTINQKIPINQKLFLLPFIITQLIRGAGYFNGGFILIALLIVIETLKSRNEADSNNSLL